MKYNGTVYKRAITCCKDCTERHEACHDHCEKYQADLADWLEKKKFVKHAKRLHREYDDFKINAVSKYKRSQS